MPITKQHATVQGGTTRCSAAIRAHIFLLPYRLLLPFLFVTMAIGGEVVKPSIPPADKHLLHVGRWDTVDPAMHHGNWIGSYIRTVVTGSTVSVILGGHTNLVVTLDGVTTAISGGPGAVQLHAAPLPAGDHDLLVGCRGGGGDACYRTPAGSHSCQ